MHKHLQKMNEHTFEKIFNQQLGFPMFKDFCNTCCEEPVPQLKFYEEGGNKKQQQLLEKKCCLSPIELSKQRLDVLWGQHSTMVSRHASGHSCPGFDSKHSQKSFRGKH